MDLTGKDATWWHERACHESMWQRVGHSRIRNMRGNNEKGERKWYGWRKVPGNGSLAFATATQMIRGIFPPFRPPLAMANSWGFNRAVNCSSVGKNGRRLGSVRSPSTGKLTKRRRKQRRYSENKRLKDCMLLKSCLK